MTSGGTIFDSLLAGFIAGLASGFLGVSPGGFLVPVISLLLPFSQHMAQGISLVVQAPPTSISGLVAYLRKGHRVAIIAIAVVSVGFIAGGPMGALIAKICSERELRWMFVCYLLILSVLSMLKGPRSHPTEQGSEALSLHSFVAFIGIGLVAGISSGLLGIGGGLAITALYVVLFRKNQHEAQALSLAITALPLTLPAAWVYYVHQGWNLPWEVIGGLVVGLTFGSWIGAMFANRLTQRKLKVAFASLLLALAAYMAAMAVRS